MSLLGTLNTGASGLGNSSSRLSVIGDNIANMGTTGFKGMRANFSDLMPSSMGGIGGSNQMGRGATLGSTMSLFGQGGLKSSDSALDFAISGEGFFPVTDGSETYYTRDGTFFMDNEGFLTNGAGMNLQGTTAADGVLTGLQGDLQIDRSAVPPQATENITIDLMLSAETVVSTDDFLNTATFDGTTTTGTALEDIEAAFGSGETATGYTSSVTVYDDLGVSHDVLMAYERVSDTEWTFKAFVDGGKLDNAAYEDGGAVEIASGTLAFTDGELDTALSTAPSLTLADTFSGTTGVWSPEFDWGVDFSTGEPSGDGNLSMAGSQSSMATISQDGYAPGELTGVNLDGDGNLMGTYTNGEERIMGQLSLATFGTNTGLNRVGGNLFQQTVDSGQAVLGGPGVGRRGSVTGYALEQANVELEEQFVEMISGQRAYQANSRVVSTANDTLQELVNLV